MSVLTSSASTSATPEPVIYQAPVNVSLPNVPDQMHEFRLFKCHLDPWFQLCKIKVRNAWTIYYASWARKVTQLWTIGSKLMKPTNEIQRNSSIIFRAPWMIKFPPSLSI